MDKATLSQKAVDLRQSLLRVSHLYKIPHLGSCLSCVEILVYAYWSLLQIDTNDPSNGSRDKFILSKGHAAPALLQVLAQRGYFAPEEIDTFGKDGSYFHEHPPKPGLIPGVEAATGSLGHGFSMAVGMAIASKIKADSSLTVVLVGDGECNEGVVWEAAMLSRAQKLSNLLLFIDYNKWQATARTNEVLILDDLASKWKSFGWHCQEVNGHSFEEIHNAVEVTKNITEVPSVIILHTVKGKGVSFMEDNNNWHYRTPNKDEYLRATSELGPRR